MICDLTTAESGVQFEADVCLVGAGAAGIAIAHELSRTNASVVLLESGGLRAEKPDQDLNMGEVVGLDYKGMTLGRLRALGGATNLWFGQCIRLDAIDFEKRPWVPHSGWPISSADLEGWYSRAERFLTIYGEAYDDQVYRSLGGSAPQWDRDSIRTHFTIYSPTVDLGRIYGASLKDSPAVRVLLHANAVEIETDDTVRQTRGVQVRTLTGKTARVRTKVVVLCAGGIENARLLLLSNRFAPQGLGNGRDLVGRFLQDHPNGPTATLKTRDPLKLSDLFALQYRGALRYFPKFPLGEATQRRERALNCTSHLVFEHAEDSGVSAVKQIYRAYSRGGNRLPDVMPPLRKALKSLPEVTRAAGRRYFYGKSPVGNLKAIRLQCHTEQEPDRDSRVTLSCERDALGLQRAKVDWRLNHAERHTLQLMTSKMCAELRRLQLADAEAEPWLHQHDGDWKNHLTDCFHHIGTTRMSDSPATGVVDRNCKVFDIQGLYVAGSSIFPTSGYANPTLTIVAMSMRLADHLSMELRRAS